MSPSELLAARARPGTPDGALAQAHGERSGAVHGLARRLVGDRMLAEEVTQEVFLRLWRRPERSDPAHRRRPALAAMRTQMELLGIDAP